LNRSQFVTDLHNCKLAILVGLLYFIWVTQHGTAGKPNNKQTDRQKFFIGCSTGAFLFLSCCLAFNSRLVEAKNDRCLVILFALPSMQQQVRWPTGRRS